MYGLYRAEGDFTPPNGCLNTVRFTDYFVLPVEWRPFVQGLTGGNFHNCPNGPPWSYFNVVGYDPGTVGLVKGFTTHPSPFNTMKGSGLGNLIPPEWRRSNEGGGLYPTLTLVSEYSATQLAGILSTPPPPPPTKWACLNGQCTLDQRGIFDSLEECQVVCKPLGGQCNCPPPNVCLTYQQALLIRDSLVKVKNLLET